MNTMEQAKKRGFELYTAAEARGIRNLSIDKREWLVTWAYPASLDVNIWSDVKATDRLVIKATPKAILRWCRRELVIMMTRTESAACVRYLRDQGYDNSLISLMDLPPTKKWLGDWQRIDWGRFPKSHFGIDLYGTVEVQGEYGYRVWTTSIMLEAI